MTNGTAIATTNAKPLTAYETMAFERYCKIVDEHLKDFIQVGEALAAMKEGKLWRVTYAGRTWEQFVDERWGFTRQRAHQLMSASALAINLSTTVDVPNERIARALGKLEDANAQRLALTTAIATAPEGKLTADWVEGTVEVVIDAMHTEGLVDTGTGEWSAMNAAITAEVHTVMLRKRAQIAANKQKSIASFIVDGNSLKLISPGSSDEKIDDDEQYRIIVYRVLTVEEPKQ